MSLTRRPLKAARPNEELRFDIETDGFAELTIDRKGVVMKEATCIWVFWVQDLYDGSWACYKGDSITEGVRRLWAAKVLRGHNILGHDIPVIERVTGLKKPAEVKVVDSLIESRLLWPELGSAPPGGNSLEEWGDYLGVPKTKYEGPWDRWTQEMEDYCKQDVVVHCGIEETLACLKQNAMVVRIEHEVTAIIARQTSNGWSYDRERGEKLIAELEIARAGIMDQLQVAFPPRVETMKSPAYYLIWRNGKWAKSPTKKAAEAWIKTCLKNHPEVRRSEFEVKPGPLRTKEHPFNPGSGDQIAERLTTKYGWKPDRETGYTDGGIPKTDYDVLSKLPYPEVKLLIAYSDNEKLLEASMDYVKRVTYSRDGKLHGSINVQGAVTGRMTHKQPNTGNVPKVLVDKDTKKYVGLSWRVRDCFRCRKGWKVVGGDAEGLELRMLANRMWRFDGGAYAKVLLEGDIHTTNMLILQKAVPEIDRDGAKTFIYGFLYGAGDAKAGRIVGRSAKVGREMKDQFLVGLPALGKVIAYCKSRAENDGSVVLLDTRVVPCRHQHAALNTLLQGDGAVVMKVALIVLDKELQRRGYVPDKDYEFLGNIHDEFQLEARPEIADEVCKLIPWAIGEAGRRLGVKIRLDGSYKVGDSWAETH